MAARASTFRARGGIDVVDDEFGSPTFAGDLAQALVELTARRGSGIFHLAPECRVSRFALAQATAELAGFSRDQVRPTSTAEFLARYPLPARRPPDSSLRNQRAAALGVTLRPWREALNDYVPRLAAEPRPQATAEKHSGG